MKSTSAIRVAVLSALLTSFTVALAQDPAPQQPPADNSKVNQRDRNAQEPTADQQSNAASDRELARQIRKALTDDKSLSTYAQNVKVIVQSGQVTLKGPVRTDEEKRNIESIASSIAGTGKVVNELQVAPQK